MISRRAATPMKNEVLEHSEDLVRYIEKVGTSLDNINSLSDEDVEIATTPKTAVFKKRLYQISVRMLKF